MEIIDQGPEVRATRHAHKDFATGGLTPEGEFYAQEVGKRDFSDKKVDRMISSSSGRVQATIGRINENSGEPLPEDHIDVKGYLGLDGMNKDFLGEFDRRVEEYEKNPNYVEQTNKLIDIEGVDGSEKRKNRLKEIIQDQVAQDFLNGKFAISDAIASSIYIKKISQFLSFYEIGKFNNNEHPPMVLAGTHQTVNESIFRGLFGNDLPQIWRSPVGYAERVGYQPVTIADNGEEYAALKIEFRGHTEYVRADDIYALRKEST